MLRMVLLFRFEPDNPYYGVSLENVQQFDPKPYECPFCKKRLVNFLTLCHRAMPGAIVRMNKAPLKGVKGHPELKGKELWQVGVPFVCDNKDCNDGAGTNTQEQIWPLGVAEEVKEILS